jgi:DNA-directed RNA polymerase subunit RPC12/RpoP
MPSFDEPDKLKQSMKTLDRCPHCGVRLSRWEQVLLSVDRALMCKNCWYRIILDVFEGDEDKEKKK